MLMADFEWENLENSSHAYQVVILEIFLLI
jgi:hypothetical protein